MFVVLVLSFLAYLLFLVVIDQTSHRLRKLQDNKGEDFEQLKVGIRQVSLIILAQIKDIDYFIAMHALI
jgi:hypothetical protein